MKHPNYPNQVPNIQVNISNNKNNGGKLNNPLNPANLPIHGSHTTNTTPPQSQYLPLWKVSGNFLVRTNSVSKVILGFAVLFTLAILMLLSRIHSVEAQNLILKVKIHKLETRLNLILSRFPDEEVPEETQNYDDNDDESVVIEIPTIIDRIKRETNDTNPRNPRKIPDQLTRQKGKTSAGNNFLKHQIQKLKKRLKALNFRFRDAISKLKNQLLSSTAANSLSTFDTKGIYLIPSAPNVNIREAELELIGPWYAASDGSQYGFNDYWYNDISLDHNGTSVIFHESGLHLIYAQVYYHISLIKGETPPPMGYRIYLRKNNTGKKTLGKTILRPIPLAECVPSYPSTFYQTCFTQVVWHVERGDQIYLEHFADSYPMIEADDNGKTFLGIVKLSSSTSND